MATTEYANREAENLRQQLAHERDQLADSIAALRGGGGIGVWMQGRLPLLAAASFATAFLLAGGIGATARLLVRRGRDGRDVFRVGRYVVVDRG
jgi:hypothetical protein